MGDARHGNTTKKGTWNLHVDSDWAKGTREEVDEWGHNGDQRHSGEAVVESASVARIEHGRSRVLRGHHRGNRGSRECCHMIKDMGLSAQFRVSTHSNAAKTIASSRGLGKNRHFEWEYLWLQGSDQIGKSEDESGPRRATFGGPLDEGIIVERG